MGGIFCRQSMSGHIKKFCSIKLGHIQKSIYTEGVLKNKDKIPNASKETPVEKILNTWEDITKKRCFWNERVSGYLSVWTCLKNLNQRVSSISFS